MTKIISNVIMIIYIIMATSCSTTHHQDSCLEGTSVECSYNPDLGCKEDFKVIECIPGKTPCPRIEM